MDRKGMAKAARPDAERYVRDGKRNPRTRVREQGIRSARAAKYTAQGR